MNYKLVPVEPTREMWAAAGDAIVALKGNHHDAISEAVYKAMLAAAPKMEQGEDKLINDISELFGIGINQRTHSVIMTNVKNSLDQSRVSGKLAEALELLLDTEDQDCPYLDGHCESHYLDRFHDGCRVAKAKAALASYYNGGDT